MHIQGVVVPAAFRVVKKSDRMIHMRMKSRKNVPSYHVLFGFSLAVVGGAVGPVSWLAQSSGLADSFFEELAKGKGGAFERSSGQLHIRT